MTCYPLNRYCVRFSHDNAAVKRFLLMYIVVKILVAGILGFSTMLD